MSYNNRQNSNLQCKWALWLILIGSIISLFNSLLFPEQLTSTGVYIGNKLTTLFGNEYCLPMMLVPLYVLLAEYLPDLQTVYKYQKLLVLFGVFTFFISPSILLVTTWLAFLFYPYTVGKEKIYALVVTFGCIFSGFFIENTMRTYLIVLALGVTNYVIVYRFYNLTVIKILSFALIIIPLFYSVQMIIMPDISIFEYLSEQILGNTNNEEISADTRTFLYIEIVEDLTKSEAWLFGKGADAHYFSYYFLNSTSGNGDFFYRLCTEVTFLQNLLRGGVFYAVSYIILFIMAIYKGLTSNNRFVLYISLMASSWFAISFMSFLHGASWLTISFFILLGCCLNQRWLDYSDEEIELMMVGEK